MNKVAIIYWSGTGNTRKMAEAVEEGVKNAGGSAALFEPRAFNADDIEGYDAVALGCPSMGDEVLEEDEFQPLYDKIRNKLTGKKTVLFGSYGWGDGEWMRNWADDCSAAGCVMAAEPVIANYEPDENAIEQCRALGAAVA